MGWNIEVTAVEINEEIAAAYKILFPNDKVIVADAHRYLLEHFKDFDFIWSSPPCPTHSRLRLSHPESLHFPDMSLYQEFLLLNTFFKGKFVIENVIPYYEPLICPRVELDRHLFWSNFNIDDIEIVKGNTDVSRDNKEGLAELKGINLDNIEVSNKRLLLRNAVPPKIGKHIFNCAFNDRQVDLSEVLKQ